MKNGREKKEDNKERSKYRINGRRRGDKTNCRLMLLDVSASNEGLTQNNVKRQTICRMHLSAVFISCQVQGVAHHSRS
jgi:hypothetical protein